MKIVVIGASGLVGSAVVKELAQRGHIVNAIARNIDKIQKDNNIEPISADINSPDFYKHLQNVDAVISAFYPGWYVPNQGEEYKKGANNIIEAAKKANVPYMLVVGGDGSLFVAPNLQLIDTPQFPKEIFDGANACRNHLKDLQNRKDVNWSFISPAPMFGAGQVSYVRSGKYRLGKDNPLTDKNDNPADISVSDMAVAIADVTEKKQFFFERFTVAYEL